MSKMPWFRYYSETSHDKKIDLISEESDLHFLIVHGVWSILLCLANDSPIRGSLYITKNKPFRDSFLAEDLHLSIEDTKKIIECFIEYDMLEIDENSAYKISNWDTRQFQSDNSNERVEKYRNKRKESGLSVAPSYDTKEVCNRYGNACVYCGSSINLVVDHAYPITLGGTDDPDNLVCACKGCNSGKSGRTPEQAGYKFINPIAEDNYKKYLSQNVTVTEAEEVTVTSVSASASLYDSAFVYNELSLKNKIEEFAKLPIPQSPLQANKHPLIALFMAGSDYMPPEKEYKNIIDTFSLIKGRYKDHNEIVDDIKKYSIAWTSRNNKNGEKYKISNLVWFYEWFLNDSIPNKKPYNRHSLDNMIIDNVEQP